MSPERTDTIEPDRGHVLRRFTWTAAALLALGTLAFLGIADEVMKGDTLQLDQCILLTLRVPGNPDNPIGPPLGRQLPFLDDTVTPGVVGLLLEKVNVRRRKFSFYAGPAPAIRYVSIDRSTDRRRGHAT